MSSCFGNARQNEIPQDFSFSCTETEIRKLLGEFHSQTRYQIQPSTGNLKFWEISIAEFLLALREAYPKYRLRLKITSHLFYHVAEFMIHYCEGNFGMGSVNYSEFERTHSKYKLKISGNMPKNEESDAFRKTIFSLTNQYNKAHL